MTDERQDMASLYAIGLLDPDQRLELEAAAAVDPALQREIDEWQEIAVAIALSAEPATPPPALRERLLGEVHRYSMARRPQLTEAVPGIHVLRAGQGKWQKTPYRGVSVQTLFVDGANDLATSLLRLEPGASYPPHRHTAEEQCWVLEGDVHLGDLHAHANDFTTAVPGSVHGRVWTENGCLLLIIASPHDEVLE